MIIFVFRRGNHHRRRVEIPSFRSHRYSPGRDRRVLVKCVQRRILRNHQIIHPSTSTARGTRPSGRREPSVRHRHRPPPRWRRRDLRHEIHHIVLPYDINHAPPIVIAPPRRRRLGRSPRIIRCQGREVVPCQPQTQSASQFRDITGAVTDDGAVRNSS